jgi:hypothetical protein
MIGSVASGSLGIPTFGAVPGTETATVDPNDPEFAANLSDLYQHTSHHLSSFQMVTIRNMVLLGWHGHS